MKRFGQFAAATAAWCLVATASATAGTTLEVLYAVPANYKALQEQLAVDFQRDHPGIVIKYRNPATTYDAGTAEVLRSGLVGAAPDVYFQGLNQVRVMVSQGYAVPLDKFVSRSSDWAEMGYIEAMMALGDVEGKKYGLPFAISTPVTYVNEELLGRAGISYEQLPATWAELVSIGKRIDDKANGVVGFLYAYDTTGNWFHQALITSAGGTYGSPDGCRVSFGDARGLAALQVLESFAKAGMPEMGWAQGRQAFIAGKLGIFVESSSGVGALERAIAGKFKWRTLPFPVVREGGRLPAGGTVAMILTKDPEKQKAAWQYIKYVTGPAGQTLMAQMTGYAPGNQKALDDPKLLGGYYEQRPNHATGINQLPIMTGWYSWAGPNSVKIVDVIQTYINNVVGGRRSAADTLPLMVADVQKLLPNDCATAAGR